MVVTLPGSVTCTSTESFGQWFGKKSASSNYINNISETDLSDLENLVVYKGRKIFVFVLQRETTIVTFCLIPIMDNMVLDKNGVYS